MEVNASAANASHCRKKKKDGRIVRLNCSVKNYDWGRIGAESGVARLYALNNGGAGIEGDRPYAEFWMGTHESGPSYLAEADVHGGGATDNGLPNGGLTVAEEKKNDGSGVSLKTWIEQNPSVLGDKVLAMWGPNLPFLFKVLSVAKALSIQAHPDKVLAAQLHKKQPNLYKDDNHKPEMALALTEFEALCGFISLKDLKEVVHDVPEIAEVVSQACVDKVLNINEQDGEEKAKNVLRSLFYEIMSASNDVISQALDRLISRLEKKNEGRGLTEKEKLVLQLQKQYPADIGIMTAFLLNYVKLKPGEALYLGANEPHAYINGECVECMATSDNVVRAGLTPKHRDVQILCSMLTYKQGLPDILQGVALNMFTTRYSPPFDEFEVDRCILPEGSVTVFPAVPSPSIFLVMEGRGTMCTTSSEEVVAEGDVLFTTADVEVIVATTSGLHFYRAGANSRLFLAGSCSPDTFG